MKSIGRSISNFDCIQWDVIRYKIMSIGLMAKFTHNPDLKVTLLSTGDVLMTEASPFDESWGIGLRAADAILVPPKDWPSKNLLRIALMELRTQLSR